MTPPNVLEIDRDAIQRARSVRSPFYDHSEAVGSAATGPSVASPSVSTGAPRNTIERALAFVMKVIAHSRGGRPMTASDEVLEFLERQFDRGDFEVCDAALSALSASGVQHQLPSEVLVAVLAITAPASRKLAARRKFYDTTIATLRDKLPTEDLDAIASAYR